MNTRTLVDARQAGRRLADGEPDAWLDAWPNRGVGERASTRDALADMLGLSPEHRRRMHYQKLVQGALAAYELRMDARKRSLSVVRRHLYGEHSHDR